MRYRGGRADDGADIIDMLTMHPEARRQVVRLLSEIETVLPNYQQVGSVDHSTNQPRAPT